MLSPQEKKRYSRHLVLPNFGMEGQLRLKAARVLVVGAGGLGAPLLTYLAAAGIGTIGIVDFDRVEDSNLQRQTLFTTADIGTLKTEAAAARLRAMNPYIHIETFPVQFTRANALEIIKNFDVVADGTDNFPTRYLVNDACVIAGKINVYASIFRFEGQVAVFNFPNEDGTRGVNYRDLFPTPPPPSLIPNCAEGGVLGVLPGIVGSMQAAEVLKIVAKVGEVLNGKMLLIDVTDFSMRTLKIKKWNKNPITELIDYEVFCGIVPSDAPISQTTPIKNITQSEWQALEVSDEDFQLIDVREPREYAISNLGGELMPLHTIRENVHRISKNKRVILHCKTGARSSKAISMLQAEFGFDNLWNLEYLW
jgi:sulfur-carrier protein adenylyltransferase/sulfurtransferase